MRTLQALRQKGIEALRHEATERRSDEGKRHGGTQARLIQPNRIVWLCLAAMTLASTARAEKPVPAHPNDLQYPKLDYKIPPASQFREVLQG